MAPETNMSIPAGAGGIVSTPTDLNIFYTCLFNGRAVTEHSLDIMKEIHGDFGMGLFQIPFHKRTGYGHNGKIDEFFTMAVYFPEDNVSVAYTSNGGLYPVNDILTGVLSIYFGKEYVLPNFKPGIELKTEDPDKYPGIYSSQDFPFKIHICRKGDILIGRATGQSSFILDAYELHKFKYDQAMLKIEFLPEEKKLILQQGGQELVFTKEE
jgi:CubicO group peptidase (beta-lactamase class C family)